jgi:hypothetical protein
MGALRISTSPAAFGDDPLSALDAWRQWESLEADSRFEWGEEHPNLNQDWKAITSYSNVAGLQARTLTLPRLRWRAGIGW